MSADPKFPDPVPDPRRHDLDALRAAAMLLGIVYHAALSFAEGLPWLVEDTQRSVAAYHFQAAVHGFRMPLFMLVSGFFTAMLWQKRGTAQLLKHRFLRVLLPCLAALFTIGKAMEWSVGYVFAKRSAETPAAALGDAAGSSIWSAIRQRDAAALAGHLENPEALTTLHPVHGFTPLTWAAIAGDNAALHSLLGAGSDPNARNRDGGTALHAAAFLGRPDIVSVLLDKGADPQARSGNGEVPADSARSNPDFVPFVARLLAIEADPAKVAIGRTAALRLLGSDPAAQAERGIPWNELMNAPTFSFLWFLWILWWLVVAFAILAALFPKLFRWRIPDRWILPPHALVWLVPLTMLCQHHMTRSPEAFGPDTSMGLIPFPRVFAYYAVFFTFGIFWFANPSASSPPLRHWPAWMVLALAVFFPALDAATGRFGWFTGLPGASRHLLSDFLQSLYAWLMTFAWLGLFGALVTKASQRIRWLSDSAYWLYLAHLPLVILAQDAIRTWPVPAMVKLPLLSAVIIGLLLLSYRYLVRPTPLGTFLNGPRRRPALAGSVARDTGSA
jgi:hypothetical protein